MNTLTARPPVPGRAAGARSGMPRRISRHPRPLFDGAGGGPTLDQIVSGAWEELTAHAVVECPLCDGYLEPVDGEHGLPVGGRCRRCGTTLT